MRLLKGDPIDSTDQRFAVRVMKRMMAWLAAIACVCALGCGGKDKPAGPSSPDTPPAAVDSIPPAVAVLIMTNQLVPGGVLVSWDAVGDDGMTGLADHYDLRYATNADADSTQRIRFSRAIEPKPPGQRMSALVSPLEDGHDYWFWLRVYDEVGNHSESAPARGRTGTSCSPPDSVADFAVVDSSATALRLRWTFPNPRTGDKYELRTASRPITSQNWNNSVVTKQGSVNPSAPSDSIVIGPLTPRSVRYFGVRWTRNCWSSISPLVGRTTGLDAPGWHGMPTMLSPLDGHSPVVTTAVVFRDRLYIGGRFAIGSGTGCCLAEWDGAGWSSISDLPSASPRLLPIQDWLFVTSGDRIMAWDGTEVTTIGRAVGSAVSFVRLVEYFGNLVVAGSFDSVDGQLAPGLARWDGSSWSWIHVRENQGITAAAVFNGELVVAAWQAASGTVAIEACNGSDSRTLATVKGTIASMDVVDDSLYLIGHMEESPEQEVRIATLEGGVLHPEDEGLGPGSVTGLARLGTQLLALGTFPGGMAVREGTNWRPVETGIEQGAGVYQLVSWDGHSVVTGSFTRVGFGMPVTGIALWNQEAVRMGAD